MTGPADPRLLAACQTRELVAACAFGLPDDVPVSDVAAAVLRSIDAADAAAGIVRVVPATLERQVQS